MAEAPLLAEHNLGPIVTNDFGESFFYNLNRHAFDQVSAQVLFDAEFADVLFKEDSLNIVIGTDSGLLPRYVQKKQIPNGSRFIFIEPESVLKNLQASGMLDDLDNRIACIDMSQWDQALNDFKVVDYFYIDSVRSINAICAQDDFIQDYAELSWAINENLSKLHWRYSVELGMEAFITRQISNVADNRLPAMLLKNAFQDKTVILLGGGPSLDQALPWVKQHRRNVVVFAVSRISRQLLSANIEPDFVFSVDPTDLSFDISKEMLQFSDRVTFVTSYHSVSTLINQWTGQVLYLGNRLPWDSALNVANFSGVGPTVTNTALNIAYEFGFKRIILAGVDLCFTREGFTHAKGSDEYLAGPRFNLTPLQVETNAGYLAPTSSDFIQAIATLSTQAKLLTTAGCEIINASDSAAKIENIGYEFLQNIDVCQEFINDSVIGGGAENLSQADDYGYLRKLLAELKRAQYQIRTIAKLAEDARRINEQMYNAGNRVIDFKDKKRLDKIEKRFRREYRHHAKLIKKFGIRSFIKLAKPFSDEEWNIQEVQQLGDAYYQAYAEGSRKILTLIDEAIDRVVARQEECSESPNFDLLIEQANRDRSFGRVRLWRRKFDGLDIPSKVTKEFDKLESQFEQVLLDKNTQHFLRAKSHSQLNVVRQRANLLFKHKKTEELQDLLSALEKHQEKQAATPYRCLICGYLAELEGNFEQALSAYQEVVDCGKLVLEEALSRIATISIDHDHVQMVDLSLQCLSQLNPIYLPLYAEVQRLHGDMMVAIDAYASYINKFPQDTLVQMKLANLYTECKIYDSAEMMLDFMLRDMPDMGAALALKQKIARLKMEG